MLNGPAGTDSSQLHTKSAAAGTASCTIPGSAPSEDMVGVLIILMAVNDINEVTRVQTSAHHIDG